MLEATCGFGNTAMVLAEKGDIPRVFAISKDLVKTQDPFLRTKLAIKHLKKAI